MGLGLGLGFGLATSALLAAPIWASMSDWPRAWLGFGLGLGLGLAKPHRNPSSPNPNPNQACATSCLGSRFAGWM